MAKLALINRNEKRKKLVAKYAKRRAALTAIVQNTKVSDEERFAALPISGHRLRPVLPRRPHHHHQRLARRADRPGLFPR
jgi:hypothetical protein